MIKKFEVKKENYRTTNFGFVIPVGEATSEGIFNTLEEAKEFTAQHLEAKQINFSDLTERYFKLHIYELEAKDENGFDISNLGISDDSDDKKEIWINSNRDIILTKTLVETFDKNYD